MEQQVEILKSRGLFIENEVSALNTLEISNYYRLHGYYTHMLENNSDKFKPGSSFLAVSALHSFDNELRILLLKLLLDIEITARARIAYTLAHAWGPMGYRINTNYSNADQDKFSDIMDKIDKELSNSRERFISNHKQKYGEQFPIWVTVEVMSFGDLSKLYYILPTSLKKKISFCYDGLYERLFNNWIQCCAVLRNICAHNSRIYSRSITTSIIVENNTEKFIAEITDGKFKDSMIKSALHKFPHKYTIGSIKSPQYVV